MKKLSKNILGIIIGFFLLTLLFAGLSDFAAQSKEELSISEVARRVQNGQVEAISVSGNAVDVTLTDGTEAVSQKESETGIVETLKSYGVTPAELTAVNLTVNDQTGAKYWASILIPTLLPLIVIIFFFWWMFKNARGGMDRAFTFGKANLSLWNPKEQQKTTFGDVAGLEGSKEELEEVVEFLRNQKKFLDLGARIPRGVLLVGQPGTGKTLLARATAGESKVPFFHISASEFVEMFVGVGASRVRDVFQTAKKAAPAIIFIDEIDAVGRQRGSGLGGGHDEREQTLNQILVEMDGFDRDTNVIVIAASVTGDTPVLVRRNSEYQLAPIADIVDSYYADGEADIEKDAGDLYTLGFEKREDKRAYRIPHFGGSAYQKVRGVFRHKVNEIYEVAYQGGVIRTTGNHSVFVNTRNGIVPKRVDALHIGEQLVGLPHIVNRTRKAQREVRASVFPETLDMKLSVYQPLLSPFGALTKAYAYARAETDMSQQRMGILLGYSPRTIGLWRTTTRMPRALSRAYFKHEIPEEVQVTPQLMRLFGYYTAEGYARKEIDFCFHEKESEKISDVKRLMREIFGIEPDAERHVTEHAVNIVYHSKPLAVFFAHHCGKGAHHKHVPAFLFSAPRDYFTEFLQGYFNGDGYRDKQGRIELTSVSKQLIIEISWLARMHGSVGYVHSYQIPEGRRINGGKPLRAVTAWRLGFGKTQNPLAPEVGKESVLRPKIKSIRKVPYEGYVYDFCGCDNEAFFGGTSPVLLHNTNRPDILDPALLRPGRFDRRIVLEMPDMTNRRDILKLHGRGKKLSKNIDFEKVAVRTPGFSGADLANLMNEAAILAARRNRSEIQEVDIFDSVEKVMLGPERRSRVIPEQEKEITAYHEAGHAIVAAGLKDADPIHKISIVNRGFAGGYTIKLPTEERRLKTRAQFLADITVALGGYAAEELTFKDVTTGSSSDIKQLTELAHDLVTKYGMSEKLGPRQFGEPEELVFLGKELSAEKNYSESIAAEIDREVDAVIGKALKTAKKILTTNRDALRAVAELLKKQETIEQAEFEKIVKQYKVKKVRI